MIMEDLCLKILEQRGIKPTAIRMLVLKGHDGDGAGCFTS